MERILMIDDDAELCELTGELLAAEGWEVDACHHGQQGLERALHGKHDALILDFMLPGINGLEVLRRLRASGSTVPVLMLTARGGDASERVIGLEMGADDYLPKPFHSRELVARLRSIVRRRHDADPPHHEAVTVGDLRLDPGARSVSISDSPVALTSVEFDILSVLVRNAGTVVPRERLLRDVLGRELTPYDRSIDMHVSNLRRKLGDDNSARILTIRSVGYQYALAAADVAA